MAHSWPHPTYRFNRIMLCTVIDFKLCQLKWVGIYYVMQPSAKWMAGSMRFFFLLSTTKGSTHAHPIYYITNCIMLLARYVIVMWTQHGYDNKIGRCQVITLSTSECGEGNYLVHNLGSHDWIMHKMHLHHYNELHVLTPTGPFFYIQKKETLVIIVNGVYLSPFTLNCPWCHPQPKNYEVTKSLIYSSSSSHEVEYHIELFMFVKDGALFCIGWPTSSP